jgi:crossover junction endodeoxyribonuclease RuvC
MTNSVVRILGIDPGYDRLGICVIEKHNNGKEIVLFSDCIITNKKDSESVRFLHMGEMYSKVLKKFNPTEVAIEKLFFVNNISTGIAVAGLCGIIKYLTESFGVPLYEYTPTQVKLAIASHGRASKDDVHAMVLKLITLPVLTSSKKRLDDEIDALAVALTHSASIRSHLYKKY